MARRKLPFEIAEQSLRDLAKLTRPLDWPTQTFNPDDLIRDTIEAEAKRLAGIAAEITPLPELLEAERQQLITELREIVPQKSKGGAPKKADPDQVRAFVAKSTPPGRKPSAFTKRRACEEHHISERTLRRILSGQN